MSLLPLSVLHNICGGLAGKNKFFHTLHSLCCMVVEVFIALAEVVFAIFATIIINKTVLLALSVAEIIVFAVATLSR